MFRFTISQVSKEFFILVSLKTISGIGGNNSSRIRIRKGKKRN